MNDSVHWCENVRGGTIEAVEQRGELGRAELLGERSGASHVGEQDRYVYLRAAGRKYVVSVVAKAGVLAGRAASEYLSDGTADAGHGQQTAGAAM